MTFQNDFFFDPLIKCILCDDDSAVSTYVLNYNVMISAEVINNKPKCFKHWLKSNRISIDDDKTKFMLLSCNKNIYFPLINEMENYFCPSFGVVHYCGTCFRELSF